jgi:hypothetical protein
VGEDGETLASTRVLLGLIEVRVIPVTILAGE